LLKILLFETRINATPTAKNKPKIVDKNTTSKVSGMP
jgi:hypothetical protein